MKFQEWTFVRAQSVRAQMHVLIRLTKAWLQSDPAGPSVVERVNHCLRALPYDAKKGARHGNPQSVDQLVLLVESHRSRMGRYGFATLLKTK